MPEDSDGTLVDTSSSTTPTPSLLEEEDLDSTEGCSQPIGGTLPLTDKSPSDSVSTKGDPQEKDLPPSPLELEGPTPRDTSNQDTSNYPLD